jgi:hypothetical protein
LQRTFGNAAFVQNSMVARWYIFKPKIQISDALAMEDIGRVYVHLVDFTAICHILWAFGIFPGYLVYFSDFGMMYQELSGNRAEQINWLIRNNTSVTFLIRSEFLHFRIGEFFTIKTSCSPYRCSKNRQ